MPLPSLCPELESNLMSNRKVIELVLQLKSAKAHGKNCIKVKPYLVRHLLRNRLLIVSYLTVVVKVLIVYVGFLPRGGGGAEAVSLPPQVLLPPEIWSENNRKVSITKKFA